MVKRERGDAGTVTLAWRIDQLLEDGSTQLGELDFNSSTGEIIFNAGQLREVSTQLGSRG